MQSSSARPDTSASVQGQGSHPGHDAHPGQAARAEKGVHDGGAAVPATHPRADGRTLALLQALRAFAAIAVIIYHCHSEALNWLYPGQPRPPEIFPWMAGVDVFFVISGFIIVLSSRKLFGAPGGFRLFVMRRLIRVLPLYWAMTSLFLLVVLLAPGVLNSGVPDWRQILASYLFFPWPRADGLALPVYSLGWTLNYEMMFYTLCAGAVLLPRRLAVMAVALVLGLGVLIGALAGPLPEPFQFWTRPLVLDFIFGLFLGLLYGRGVAISPLVAWPGALVAAALLAMDLPTRPPLSDWPTLGPIAGYGLPATLLVAMAAFGETQKLSARVVGRIDFFRRPFASVVRVFAELGDASYALYLLHPFIIRAMRQVFVMLGFGTWMTSTLFALAGVIASSIGGWLLYRLVEAPVLRWLRRRAGV